MTEADGQPTDPPRFPYVAAIFCAACVGAAAWTWMSYSYAWDLARQADFDGSPLGRYVMVAGYVEECQQLSHIVTEASGDSREHPGWAVTLTTGWDDPLPQLWLDYPDVPSAPARKGEIVRVRGRVLPDDHWEEYGTKKVDATASRFTGASVAGLVVGAMGVFIFGLYLRTWFKARGVGRGTDVLSPTARFPRAAVLASLGCLALAAWAWTRYSYCWGVTSMYLRAEVRQVAAGRWPNGAFVAVALTPTDFWDVPPAEDGGRIRVEPLGDIDWSRAMVCVGVSSASLQARGYRPGIYIGRVNGVYRSVWPSPSGEGDLLAAYVDVDAGRFTGASVAGLVVGAMGVFMFALALRHWLGERGRARQRGRGS